MRYETLRELAKLLRESLSAAYPDLAWGPERPDHPATQGGSRVLRICAARADGPLLHAADIPTCTEALNRVLVGYSFPEEKVSGSSWGELVLTARRRNDHFTVQWRGREGMELWIDVPQN